MKRAFGVEGVATKGTGMGNREFFDHYRIHRNEAGKPVELGRGAMAATYMAEDSNLQRPVALKVIDAATLTAEQLTNFQKEARAAALLRHPNVATVYHLGSDRANVFYAMEYVEGETAASWVSRHGPMPVSLALRVALQVSRALAAAARHDVIHRDIKPANVMLCTADDADWPTVKVIDFGLAAATAESSDDGFHGTAQYASPEQVQQGPVDGRSDVYSLGCVLWFLLVGEPPFTGPLASIFSQQLVAAPPFRKLPRLPKAVRRLLARMLDKDRNRRPQPRELAEEIQAYLGRIDRQEALAQRYIAPLTTARNKLISFPPHIARGAVVMGVLIASTLLAVPLVNSISGRQKQHASNRGPGKIIGVQQPPESTQPRIATVNPNVNLPPRSSQPDRVVTTPASANTRAAPAFTKKSPATTPNPKITPPPDAPSITNPSLAVSSAQRARGKFPLDVPEAASSSDPAMNLQHGEVLAPFLGVAPDGRWMVGLPKNTASAKNSSAPVAKIDRSAKKRSRTAKSSRTTTRRVRSTHFASTTKRVVGYLLP
jgi:serine/threonine protein kinase